MLKQWLTGRSPLIDTDPNLIPLSTFSSDLDFNNIEEQLGSEVLYIQTKAPLYLGIKTIVKNYTQSPPLFAASASYVQTPCPTLPYGPLLQQQLVSCTRQASRTITL